MPNAVLIVDMVRGFLEEGNPLYCGDGARSIIPRIQKMLEQEISSGSKVFFICDHHHPNDLEFEVFPTHCVEGTEEAELIPELSRYPGKMIPKRRYSGFFDTALERELEELSPEKLIICGVCTDICVLHTVADARNRDYKVEVPTDCVASFNETVHRFALQHMESVLGARLVKGIT